MMIILIKKINILLGNVNNDKTDIDNEYSDILLRGQPPLGVLAAKSLRLITSLSRIRTAISRRLTAAALTSDTWDSSLLTSYANSSPRNMKYSDTRTRFHQPNPRAPLIPWFEYRMILDDDPEAPTYGRQQLLRRKEREVLRRRQRSRGPMASTAIWVLARNELASTCSWLLPSFLGR